MITSIFKKSTILNYSLIVVLLIVFFVLYLTNGTVQVSTSLGLLGVSKLIVLLLASFFLVNFMVKKNGLTKNSCYTVLFFLLFLMLFPHLFIDTHLMWANFFLLLAMRRMISLQTLKAPKEKIFDASMWIFIASLFHFWCILFIFIVYLSILFHVSRDYRNWLLPFIAFIVVAVLFGLTSMVYDPKWIHQVLSQTQVDFEWQYLPYSYQNMALILYSIIGVYFLLTAVFSLTNRPLILQASYKKMIVAFLIGGLLFMMSPDKNSSLLLFSFMPLAVMGTNNIEYSHNTMYQEIVLFFVTIGCFFAYFIQL
jgi:hypothetical protein